MQTGRRELTGPTRAAPFAPGRNLDGAPHSRANSDVPKEILMELPMSGGYPAAPETPEDARAHLRRVRRERHPERHPVSVSPPGSGTSLTMRLLEMNAFYPLHAAAIDDALTRRAPGNYALGYSDGDAFSVFYVGRSDLDLARCLHEWVGVPSLVERFCAAAQAAWHTHSGGWLPVGTPSLGRVGSVDSAYTHFAFSYARSAEESYAKEWRNYDAFGGHHNLDNETHPMLLGSRGSRDMPGWAQWVPKC